MLRFCGINLSSDSVDLALDVVVRENRRGGEKFMLLQTRVLIGVDYASAPVPFFLALLALASLLRP